MHIPEGHGMGSITYCKMDAWCSRPFVWLIRKLCYWFRCSQYDVAAVGLVLTILAFVLQIIFPVGGGLTWDAFDFLADLFMIVLLAWIYFRWVPHFERSAKEGLYTIRDAHRMVFLMGWRFVLIFLTIGACLGDLVVQEFTDMLIYLGTNGALIFSLYALTQIGPPAQREKFHLRLPQLAKVGT